MGRSATRGSPRPFISVGDISVSVGVGRERRRERGRRERGRRERGREGGRGVPPGGAAASPTGVGAATTTTMPRGATSMMAGGDGRESENEEHEDQQARGSRRIIGIIHLQSTCVSVGGGDIRRPARTLGDSRRRGSGSGGRRLEDPPLGRGLE